jgi:hypothetical protein
MSRSRYWLEILCLFVVTPVLLALPLPLWLIIFAVLIVLSYALHQAWLMELFNKQAMFALLPLSLHKGLIIRLVIFMLVSTLVMLWLNPESLFNAVKQNMPMWLGLSLFYAVFSAYPQEWIYRYFFFARYADLCTDKRLLILVNAALFCWAHLMFFNTLLFVLTFAGSLVFARIYLKSRSLMLISIEHSAYGIWLYTLGMGEMLAFPVPS